MAEKTSPLIYALIVILILVVGSFMFFYKMTKQEFIGIENSYQFGETIGFYAIAEGGTPLCYVYTSLEKPNRDVIDFPEKKLEDDCDGNPCNINDKWTYTVDMIGEWMADNEYLCSANTPDGDTFIFHVITDQEVCNDGTPVGECNNNYEKCMSKDTNPIEWCTECGCPPNEVCNEPLNICEKEDPCEGVVCDDGDPCTEDRCYKGECKYKTIECPEGQICVNGICKEQSCDENNPCPEISNSCMEYVCKDGLCQEKPKPEPSCSTSEWLDYPDCKWDNSSCYIIFYIIGGIVIGLILLTVAIIYSVKRGKK